MDIFERRDISPMLIRGEVEPFDDPNYIFELKLDGIRCLAYLGDETDLRNKRNMKLSPIFPELQMLHKQAKHRCILDGELIVMEAGRPAFAQVQRRALMANRVRIEMLAAKLPASYVAYDILYCDGEQVIDQPLMKRKDILAAAVKEGGQLAISRYISEHGKNLFQLTAQQQLEGIVGKRRDSLYYPGRRTPDWVKIKNMQDDDFVVCGYLPKESRIALILGQYSAGQLVYKGHVIGLDRSEIARVQQLPDTGCPFDDAPENNEGAVWKALELVCTVKFMERTKNGGMRQPAFKCFREDKQPKDCVK